MIVTKFKAALLSNLLVELFGSSDEKFHDPLLLKNLSQKTKFHLRKLGESIQKEDKAIKDSLRELYDKYYDVPVNKEGEKPQRELKEGMKVEDFIKEATELEQMDIEISHYDFQEDDFIDKSTNDIVGGKIYYNIIDLTIFAKWVEENEIQK